MENDAELLARYVESRDAEAFSELVGRYAGMVYAVCARVTGNASEAEDAAQECFLQLARRAADIRGSMGGWLHRTAVSRSLMLLRGESRRRRREEAAARMNVAMRSIDGPAWVDLAPCVDEALAQLPDELREPLIAHFLLRKSQAEIGADLGLDRSTISRRIEKGMESLRAALRNRGVIASSALLGALLVDNTVQAAPAALMAALGKMAMAGISPGGSVAAGAAAGKGLLGGMTMAKAGIGAAGILAAAMALSAVVSSGEQAAPPPPAENALPVAGNTETVPQASTSNEELTKIIERLIADQNRTRSAQYAWKHTAVVVGKPPVVDGVEVEGPEPDEKTMECASRFVLDGNRMFFHAQRKSYNPKTGELHPLAVTYCYVDGIFKEFNHNLPDGLRAGKITDQPQTYRVFGGADFAPFICAYRLFEPSIGFVKPEDVRFAGYEEHGGQKCIAMETITPTGYVYRWLLSEDCGYRPVTFHRIAPDGRVIFDASMRYEKDEQIGWRLVSWIPIYPLGWNIPGAPTDLEVKVNDPVPAETFQLDFAPGTQVYDDVAGIEYTVGETGGSRSTPQTPPAGEERP